MNSFTFQNPVKVYFGKGSAKQGLDAELPKYGKKVLIAYGGGSIKRNGVYDEIVGILKENGKEIVEFSGINPNPRYEEVQNCAKVARDAKVDLMLAIGGGSVIDCVRAASAQVLLEEDLWTYEMDQGKTPDRFVPMGIILTLGGTGSDLNWLAGIDYEQKHVKGTLRSTHAKFDIIDPAYTMSVPMGQFTTGAFDTLSHYMEAYFGKNSSLSDEINEAIMKSVIRNTRKAIANPDDYEARSELLWASTLALSGLMLAGKIKDFQCHGMEFQISGHTSCNHGRTLAVLHPVVYKHTFRSAPEKFARFARVVMGIDDAGMTEEQTALAGIDALAAYIRELGLPTTFKALGLDMDDDLLKTIAAQCNPNPGCVKQMDKAEFYEILKECNG